jgi:hypothetical protein
MKKLSQLFGFTLVEVLIYMGLLTGFLLVISAVFSITISTQTDVVQSQQIDQDTQYLIAKIQYEVQNADSITTPAANGDTASSFAIVSSGTTYTYFVEDDQLKVSDGIEENVLTSPDVRVTSLDILRLGNTYGLSALSFDLTIQNILNNESRPLHFSVGLRQ